LAVREALAAGQKNKYWRYRKKIHANVSKVVKYPLSLYLLIVLLKIITLEQAAKANISKRKVFTL